MRTEQEVPLLRADKLTACAKRSIVPTGDSFTDSSLGRKSAALAGELPDLG